MEKELLKFENVNKSYGSKKVLKVSIDEEVVDPEDVEMLEDLVLTAMNEALEKVDAASQAAMARFSGGMPGMF